MKWMLVVLISLGCCEAGSILGILNGLINCLTDLPLCVREIMMKDWLDTAKHPPINLTQSDLDFLNNLGTDSADQPWNSTSGAGVRKECRTLSAAERTRTFDAFNWLMTTKTSSSSMHTRYQVFATKHRSSEAPGAHSGPCFMPWHRIFLMRLEKALQLFDSTCRLCYWDTSLDEPLLNPADSAIWTSDYWGNSEGDVTTGFCANSSVPLSMQLDCFFSTSSRLYRQNNRNNSYLYNQARLNAAFANMHGYTPLVTPYTGCYFEALHGMPHMFVGGHMSIISCSPLDGLFYFHHTYIDYLFDLFRRNYQTTNKETDYPTDSGVPAGHHYDDPMAPFSDIDCGGGMSENIVPRLYSYAPSPSTYTCTTHSACGGETLWCNGGKCTARVKEGGLMRSNWPNDACFIKGCANPGKATGTNLCTCFS